MTLHPPAATARAGMKAPRIEVFDGLRLGLIGILLSVALGVVPLVDASPVWKALAGLATFFGVALALRFDPSRRWAMRFAGWVVGGHRRSSS